MVGALQPSRGGALVWKSVNGGQSFSGLPALTASGVLSIVIDPVNPNIVYAGIENGVAKSVDSGQTWTYSTDLPIQIVALAIDPITTSTLYAGTNNLVARSRDSGATWTPIGLYGTRVTALAIDPVTPRTVYAGSTNAFFRSTDGGDNWTGAHLGPYYIWSLSISRSATSTIYAATDRGVLKTTTGGGAGLGDWAWANTGLPTGAAFSIAVDPTDASVAYVGTNSGVFKTTSGGNQWLPVPGVSGQIWSIAIPTGAHNTIYVGSPNGGTAVSSDGGATWTNGGPASSIYALAVDPLVPTTVYAGSTVQWDAFVARLSADGSALEYSTYLGGSGFDYGNAIAVDSLGSAYVVGATTSADFPVLNPLQATFAGVRDLFVAKISSAGALTYATYLGGSMWEDGGAIAVDASGQAHVAGYTLSGNFPTARAYQPVFGGGGADAFVATLNSTGNGLVYSTFLGGSGSESGPSGYTVGRDPVVSIAVMPSGEAYVTGATSSTNFPTLRALQATHGGGEYDAFVARFSASGLLQWSTYLGGTAADLGKRIALDPTGAVVVAGFSSSTDFPTRNPLQAGNAGSDDVFVARIVEDPPDSTPPTTTIAPSGSEGLAGWYRSTVVVTLTATDPAGESGVAFVDYKVNDAAFQSYSSPFIVAAEGMTAVTARATDVAGNVESVPPFVVIKIDTGAPMLTLESPVERDYLHSETLTLSFSARDEVSGLASGSPSATLDGVSAPTGQRIQLLTLPLGAHTFVASASDVAGNASQRLVTFHVVATIGSLKGAVNAYTALGKIVRATQNSLLETLDDAQAALDRGKVTVVRKKLADFIAVCRQRVVADVANVLIADAQYVLGTL
jgi:hypothetical protein